MSTNNTGHAADVVRMSVVKVASVDVDLVCLSCGRGRTLYIAVLADLPPRETCHACRGSIVVTGWSNRVARTDEAFDWKADRPKVGRPPSRHLAPQTHPGDEGSEQPA
jgi:hypothetical protein